MGTLEIVLHVIFAIGATEQAWQKNIFVVPPGGSPPIAPTLQHFQNISHPRSPQHLQRSAQGNRVIEVKSEGQEQFGEAPLNGSRDIKAMLLGEELFVD